MRGLSKKKRKKKNREGDGGGGGGGGGGVSPRAGGCSLRRSPSRPLRLWMDAAGAGTEERRRRRRRTGGGATLRGTKTHGEVSKSAVLRRVILLYLTSWAATGKLEGITTTTRRGKKKKKRMK